MILQARFSTLTIFVTLCIGLHNVLAGLENAKFSTKLDNSNFDQQIQDVEVGTLTAFFAPWCGHCKSLLGTWDKIAQTFQSDSKCRVAHLDADAASNREIGSKYSVSGFPTIKFLFKDAAKDPIDYNDARTPEAMIKFLNQNCGTHRALGGLLLPEAGRVATLDELAKSFLGLSSSERPAVIEKATALVSAANNTMASYYVKVMNKVVADASWLTKEGERLKKLIEKGATMAGTKFEEVQIKQNILQAFADVKATAEEAENVVEKATGEL
ncbi:hypothetical protein O181_071503 [Austropuccinia psidii MF-1]|uniref:protein disulfide-isomerase n=1 Tax=Austropuccinia psidii MF-1 TaxID=1389203 RepID=A0A9Q3I891_9BASI|nr:hypothetical protein [Austropuccinia psidii MF-1]